VSSDIAAGLVQVNHVSILPTSCCCRSAAAGESRMQKRVRRKALKRQTDIHMCTEGQMSQGQATLERPEHSQLVFIHKAGHSVGLMGSHTPQYDTMQACRHSEVSTGAHLPQSNYLIHTSSCLHACMHEPCATPPLASFSSSLIST